MPGYVGFQLSVDLYNIPVVKRVTDGLFEKIIGFATQLRQSGSDLVVEANLAQLLGRGRLAYALEQHFKEKVKIQKITPLHRDSDVELRQGPGPTLLHAFDTKPYLTTVVTVCMLASFQSVDQLATMIDLTMTKRSEMGMPDSSASPGFEGIQSTLQACVSQSNQFAWALYKTMVEDRLRSAIPNYFSHPNYMRLIPAVFLGAVDFLVAAQSLPENRKVSVSNELGCIPLIIWAHYILELTVAVDGTPQGRLVFGQDKEVQVFIRWTGDLHDDDAARLVWVPDRTDASSTIHLHEADMSIILSCEATEDDRALTSHVEERHSLKDYGTTYLSRLFNVLAPDPGRDPVYAETVNLVTGIAAHASQMMLRGGSRDRVVGPAIEFDIDRVMSAARLLFSGIGVHDRKAQFYHDRHSAIPLTCETLPATLGSFLNRVKPTRFGRSSPDERLIQHLQRLAQIVILCAHIIELSQCADLPLILRTPHQFGELVWSVSLHPQRKVMVGFDEAINGMSTLLTSNPDTEDLCLFSGHGWSVYLNVIGDRDPACVKPELIHVRPGVPTNKKKGARKMRIRDDTSFCSARAGHENSLPLHTGPEYLPRAAAELVQRKEYWNSRAQEFGLAVYTTFRLCDQLRRPFHDNIVDELMSYRSMQEAVWLTDLTPDCVHGSQPARSQPLAKYKLDPDAASLLGWGIEEISYHMNPQRIIILSTLNNPSLRWAAIMKVQFMYSQYAPRKQVLRSHDCCVDCALVYAASLSGKSVVIL